MADKEINVLTDGGAVVAGDLAHVVRGGNSRKVTLKAQLPATPASSSGPASLEFAEDTDNGSNKVTLIASASLAADVTVTLPGSTGTLALQSPVDELRIAQMVSMLTQADAINVPIWTDHFFADSFETLTYVDTAGATNLDTGTAGALKPTSTGGAISGATGTNFGNMTGNGGLTSIFNGVTNASADNSGFVSGTSGYAGKTYSSGKKIAKAVVYGTNNYGYDSGGDQNITLQLYAKNGAAPANGTDGGTLLGSVSFTDTGNESGNPREIISTDLSTEFLHPWIRVSVGSSTNLFLTEVTFHEVAVPNNLTVESKDYLAGSAPSQMQVVLFVREEEAAVAGTDYSLKLTRNDPDYGSAVTLTELYSLVLADGSTIRVVRTNVEDVSGLTSGTEPGWRFQTLTNKLAYPVGVVTYWS